MGYITTEIANITEPTVTTLAGNPNFITIEGKEKPISGKLRLNKLFDIMIVGEGQNERKVFYNYSAFSIKEKASGKIHHFMGRPHGFLADTIRNIEAIDNNIYDDKNYTFYNMEFMYGNTEQYLSLLNTLVENPFFKEKYNLVLENEENKTILFTAKGTGYEYDFELIEFDQKAIILSKTTANKPTVRLSLEVTSTDVNDKTTEIKFVDTATKTPQSLKATIDESEVNSETFFVAKNKDYSVTAENIRACMINNSFLRSHFHITIPTVIENGKVKNGTIIWLTPKGKGSAYTFDSFEINHFFIKKKEELYEVSPGDSILEGKENCEIQIDMYKDVKYEEQNTNESGSYITTLSKTYSGEPLWFDVNTIWANQNKYSDSFLNSGYDWCDTGTETSFRFTAKSFDGINHDTFYYSDRLHSLTGYCRNLETNNLSEYVYDTKDDNVIKPLTRQPILTHIKNQKQYFNFILSDPTRNDETEINYPEHRMGIQYKIYTQSGSYLNSQTLGIRDKSKFGVVNTICLNIDAVIEKYPNAGIVKACLWRNGRAISEPLVYNILPSCLYKVNDFAFLNSLGGWSSFNFGGTEQTDFKSSVNTFYRTQTPDFNISSRIESIFNKEVTEQFIVQTSPIKAEVAEWLKEISSSIAVYELSTKRYVIIDEMNVKHNSKDDLFSLQMKYHYTDSYNANIK
ncbi:hypothetical protein JGH11_14635 [Dysgonomonas sp. Marseille-P4677]|uniref:hypothetical protein n=1 Tax=Dysgonomonas sp. Marseille-P4677 TaxID=2364790 RepID=UPI0019143A6C|nr:hypothetical protein [Dysgonomonas sp. Marseille-P4677]MBK5722112.1 hypothetical protein [Dysgonomonas sp. Marseille-P4677]